jgi:hypothetical protein
VAVRCQREVQQRLNRLIARWRLKHLLEAAAGRSRFGKGANRCAGSAAAGMF